MTTTDDSKPTDKRPRRMAREPEAGAIALEPKRSTKSALVIAMLTKSGGTTLDELVSATGWLPHTTRAALTGLKKKGHKVASEKLEGVRRYHIESETA